MLKRDVSGATLEDHFDKTILPKVMQVSAWEPPKTAMDSVRTVYHSTSKHPLAVAKGTNLVAVSEFVPVRSGLPFMLDTTALPTPICECKCVFKG